MKKTSKIFVAGHRGLMGSALVRQLQLKGYKNLVLKTRSELDLLNQKKVSDFFKKEQPEYVFLAAAKVGGIWANVSAPAEFGYQNIEIQNNVIHSSYLNGVKKLLFLGSNCIYPRVTPQPIKEEYFMTGPLEKTNEAYAIAKIAGIMLCRYYNTQYSTDYIAAMPTNLYGPNDNFHLETSHVFPALIRKFHEAKMRNDPSLTMWGTGRARREFLHADDVARACILLVDKPTKHDLVNIGTGSDITIKELSELMKKVTGFKGKIVWDKTKPDGTPKKLLDIGRLKKLGFKHSIKLEDGIRKTYEWYLDSLENNPNLKK